MTQETLTAAFGWMAVLNIGFLAIATCMLWAMQDWIAGVHARMFKMQEADVRKAYFDYLAKLKILTIVFAVVPYFALKMV
ncbi:hypothetical protein QEZ52_04685 [Aliisedimentitalea scapharcae]|uniref:DUF6868 domain-containing protein n=1 Tax=Aliisedimentitalea scapharcae TaxID=1524259 RepID=A0ABZ2XYG8_9RHOB